MATDPRSDHDTSLTLLLRVQKDPADSVAWDEFVRHYRPMIEAWCRKWGLQASDCDDVTQDVLVKLRGRDEAVPVRPFPQLPLLAQDRDPARADGLHARPSTCRKLHGGTGRAARRIARSDRRPGAEAGGCLRRRDARSRHAPGREAGQAEELAGVPAHRDRRASRGRRPRSSSRCRSPSSTSPRTGCRRCSRKRS